MWKCAISSGNATMARGNPNHCECPLYTGLIILPCNKYVTKYDNLGRFYSINLAILIKQITQNILHDIINIIKITIYPFTEC